MAAMVKRSGEADSRCTGEATGTKGGKREFARYARNTRAYREMRDLLFETIAPDNGEDGPNWEWAQPVAIHAELRGCEIAYSSRKSRRSSIA